MPDTQEMIKRMDAYTVGLEHVLLDEDEAQMLLRWVRPTAWGEGLGVTPDAKSLVLVTFLKDKGLMSSDGRLFYLTRAGYDALLEYISWALVGCEFVPGWETEETADA